MSLAKIIRPLARLAALAGVLVLGYAASGSGPVRASGGAAHAASGTLSPDRQRGDAAVMAPHVPVPQALERSRRMGSGDPEVRLAPGWAVAPGATSRLTAAPSLRATYRGALDRSSGPLRHLLCTYRL